MRYLKHYLVGVSVGIASQPSAIAIVEAESVTAHGELTGKIKTMRLRHLQRLPLSATYPNLAEQLRSLRDGLKAHEEGPSSALIVDVTGTGRSVTKFLRDDTLEPIEVCITAGMGQAEVEPGYWRVSKKELVGQLQVLMQSDSFQVSSGLDLVPEFTEEMRNFRMRASAAAGDDIDSWRDSTADDLVFATALATWRGQTDIPPSKAALADLYKKLDEHSKMMAQCVA